MSYFTTTAASESMHQTKGHRRSRGSYFLDAQNMCNIAISATYQSFQLPPSIWYGLSCPSYQRPRSARVLFILRVQAQWLTNNFLLPGTYGRSNSNNIATYIRNGHGGPLEACGVTDSPSETAVLVSRPSVSSRSGSHRSFRPLISQHTPWQA